MRFSANAADPAQYVPLCERVQLLAPGARKILIRTKVDLVPTLVNPVQADAIPVAEHGITPVLSIDCSAINGDGVAQVFEAAANYARSRNNWFCKILWGQKQ